ncbi:MAG: response regulator transcription factor [Flavobacteriia bacterium]|nr:response regulator transcription factor [Flavobacteriia bacterium]
MKKIHILLADDHSMIRKGLKLMLAQQNTFEPIFYDAENGAEALQRIKEEEIDVLLLDITLPEVDGISVLRKLKSIQSKLPVIILTMHKDKNIVKQVLELGALGYMLKNSGLEELTKAITTVLRGERFFSNEIAQMIFHENEQIKQQKSAIEFESNLSKREKQILSMIVKEMTSQDIAEEINVSKRTVEGHRKNIMDKLGIKSTVGLVKYALKNGFE